MPFWGAFLAITLSLKEFPTSIQPDAEFSVSATLECSKCGDSFLRGVFYPSGSRYFGYTQNNSGDWVSTTEDKTRFFSVTAQDVQSGTWSGQLRIKPDIRSHDYQGPGEYNFKLIRYTASGSKSTESVQVVINILGPSSTPTPVAKTPVPTIAKPSNTPQPPTAKPSPTKRPTTTPDVLGSTTIPISSTPAISTNTPSPQPQPRQVSSDFQTWFAWALIIMSVFGLLISTLFYFWPKVYT